jgi:hypothetical protein
MKDFFKTTLGRFVISVGFAVVAVIVNMVIAFVAQNPAFFTPTTVLFVNAVLFGIKNFADKRIDNI